MAVTLTAPFTSARSARPIVTGTRAHPLASVGFDWAFVAASGWFIGGLYLDGWAHNTIPSLETFFTPWHAVLYSGFLATFAVLGWGIGRNRNSGRSTWQAVPGYQLSLIGGLLFGVSGVADMLWHIAFGIEANVDALLSPTHLSLLLSGALIITGPLRAAGRRSTANTWSAAMPRMLSLTFLLLALAFFTQFANLWGGPWLANTYQPVTPTVMTAGGRGIETDFLFQGLSVSGVLIQSVLLAATSLVALRGARVPAGGFGVMLAVYAVFTVIMRQKYDADLMLPFILSAIGGALVLELLYSRVRERLEDVNVLRGFVALIPAVATAMSIAAVAASQGVWWTVHLGAGAIVIAAAVGWLLALLATPTPRSILVTE